MMTIYWLLVLALCHNVLLDDNIETTESSEIEDTTKAYDVIINDRENNDIVINDIDNGSGEEEIESEDDKGANDETHKLLAAQVNAIHVLNMIQELEEEMKEILEEKRTKQTESTEAPIAGSVETDNVSESENIEAEIRELQQRLAELTARGEKVREMIVEQTRLLLGEESALNKVRRNKIREKVKQNKKTAVGSSQSELSDEQEGFLKDLLDLENLLKALRQTDKIVFRELRKRKKRPRTKSKLERVKSTDSILDHPVISLDKESDIPTIVVEEGLEDEVLLEYEDDTPLVIVEETVVPRPAPVPHGHFLYSPRPRHRARHPPPSLRHHYSYPQYPQQYPPPYPPPQEPHITLTGSLLRGFEGLGRG